MDSLIFFVIIRKMTHTLESEFELGETIATRDFPPVIIIRAKYRQGGKPCILKIWSIHNHEDSGYKFSELFDKEVKTIKSQQNAITTFFPKLIDFKKEVDFQGEKPLPKKVDYQVFEDIKYNSIGSYYRRTYSKKLPDQVAVHVYKKIAQAVMTLNQRGLTLFKLDPLSILIDSNLNPIFTDLFRAGQTCSHEDVSKWDEWFISSCMKSPELYSKNGKFSTFKLQSFQLGVLAMFMMGSGAIFETNPLNPQYHSIYRKLTEGKEEQFYNTIKLKDLSESLKKLISSLIMLEPERRLDAIGIPNTQWWKQTTPENAPLIMENHVKSMIMKAKEEESKANKLSNLHFKYPMGKFSLFSNRSSEYYSNLNAKEHDGNDLLDCHFWGMPIINAFDKIVSKANKYLYPFSESPKHFSLEGTRMGKACSFKVKISAYQHPNNHLVTVVRYRLLDDFLYVNIQATQYSEYFEQLVEAFEAEKPTL